jgi:hypothetical protein
MGGQVEPAHGHKRASQRRIIVDNSNRWYDFSSSAASALYPGRRAVLLKMMQLLKI